MQLAQNIGWLVRILQATGIARYPSVEIDYHAMMWTLKPLLDVIDGHEPTAAASVHQTFQ
jgi:hypothetical protein